MKIRIIRKYINSQITDGEIIVDNEILCQTIEATPYCLPEGEYQISIQRVKKYHRNMPCIKSLNSQPSTLNSTLSTKIAMGNGAYALKNSTIYVGEYLVPGVVIHSQKYFDQLFERIRKALKHHDTVNLIITNK